jgi:antitoxin MazE
MATTIQRWGNSLGVRIPRSVAEHVRFARGTQVEFETSGRVLMLRPKRRRGCKLADLLARMKGPNPHRALDRGRPVGRESI